MIREGQIYEAREDAEVTCMTSWAAPFTGGHDRVFPKGERVTIASDPPDGATAVYCDPWRYEELHESMVPEGERKNRKYRGYYLCIELKVLEDQFDRKLDPGELGRNRD